MWTMLSDSFIGSLLSSFYEYGDRYVDKFYITYDSRKNVSTMYANPHIYIYLVLISYVLFMNIIIGQ